jgi:hypothetical protein
MEKNIKKIIEEAAKRYNLGYDENQKGPSVQSADGSLKELSFHDIDKVFNIQFNSIQQWKTIDNKVIWAINDYKFKIDDDMYKFDLLINNVA